MPGAKGPSECLTPQQAASRLTQWTYRAPAPMRESASTGFPDIAAMQFVSKAYIRELNVQTSAPFPYAFTVYAGYMVIQRPGLYKLSVEYARMVRALTPSLPPIPCLPCGSHAAPRSAASALLLTRTTEHKRARFNLTHKHTVIPQQLLLRPQLGGGGVVRRRQADADERRGAWLSQF
jgi:hypothetical protein